MKKLHDYLNLLDFKSVNNSINHGKTMSLFEDFTTLLPTFIAFIHEIIHYLSRLLDNHPNHRDVESIVIYGITDLTLLLDGIPITENSIRQEWGLLPRVSHGTIVILDNRGFAKEYKSGEKAKPPFLLLIRPKMPNEPIKPVRPIEPIRPKKPTEYPSREKLEELLEKNEEDKPYEDDEYADLFMYNVKMRTYERKRLEYQDAILNYDKKYSEYLIKKEQHDNEMQKYNDITMEEFRVAMDKYDRDMTEYNDVALKIYYDTVYKDYEQALLQYEKAKENIYYTMNYTFT